jgi:hypothetical protein
MGHVPVPETYSDERYSCTVSKFWLQKLLNVSYKRVFDDHCKLVED